MLAVYGLDANFETVTAAIPFTNLQWKRRYYSAGEFEMQVPIDVYEESWSYIYVQGRPEIGVVEKISVKGGNSTMVSISGFFAEKLLDRRTCYPRYVGDVQNTETSARNIFAKYKGDLPIELDSPNDPLLGDRTQSDFSDDSLGKKLYSILQTRELSYRVRYDYVENKLYFSVWSGLNRTQSQDVNPYKVFSEGFGNIADKTLDIDNSAYKNYAIIPVNADDDGFEQDTYYLDLTNGEPRREVVLNFRSDKPEDDESMAQFKDRVLEQALEKMEKYKVVNDLDVDQVSDEGYMTDYDLGDVCDVIIESLGLKMEVRIVEVYEVFKSKGHSITLGFGNKRLTNLERAVLDK